MAGHVARMEKRRAFSFWWGNLKDTPLKCLVAYRRIILKYILKQVDGELQTDFVWIRTAASFRLLWTR